MLQLHLRYDMRAPSFGADVTRLYRAAIEQCAWADRHGFSHVLLSEHHGAEDGYLPSPLPLAGAIAARTERIRIRTMAIILPLHDPIRIAEDAAVLDILSGGRMELLFAAGYVPSEFEMFGRERKDRVRLLEEGIEAIKQAWTGEPFDYQGRRVLVRPRPLQRPRPPIYLGGSAEPAARRAARIADGFVPTLPRLYKLYAEECAKLGKEPGLQFSAGPLFLHVADDPDAAWRAIGPHALHDMNSYATWLEQAGIPGIFRKTDDVAELRARGAYQVLTPDECLALCRRLRPGDNLLFHPLMGGLDPDIAWASLELFAAKVLPHLDIAPTASPAIAP